MHWLTRLVFRALCPMPAPFNELRAAAEFHVNGYTLLPNVIPAALVKELSRKTDEYIQQRGPRLRNMATLGLGSKADNTARSWILVDVQNDEELRPLFTACDREPRLRRMLSLILRRPVRFLQRNEVVVNQRLTWHRDALQGELGAYTRHLPAFSEHDRHVHPIVAVGVFLESHVNDSMGLVVKPGSHLSERAEGYCPRRLMPTHAAAFLRDGATAKPPAASTGSQHIDAAMELACRRDGVVLPSGLGDALLFDTRVQHRSGRDGWSVRVQRMWEKQVKHRNRKLLTLSYGAPSAFSDAHERAVGMRNRLLTEKGLCNLTLGLPTRFGDAPVADRECVRRAVRDDLRRFNASLRGATIWRGRGLPSPGLM